MAKNSGLMPMATSGGNSIGRRLVAIVVALVVLSLLIHDPIGSANAVAAFFSFAGRMIDALTAFAHALSSR